MNSEQRKKIIDKLNETFLPENQECDGAACMGCWKDVIRRAIKMIEETNCLQKQESDAVEWLLNEYKKDQLPDADSPFHHEAEIAAGFKSFIIWLRHKESQQVNNI